ncbi:MAG: tetratricopeptide repeat protein, partial [Actinomycetota bacterium]
MAIVGAAVVLVSAAATAAGELELKAGMAALIVGIGVTVPGLYSIIAERVKRRNEERDRGHQDRQAHEAELRTLVVYRGPAGKADPQQLGISRSAIAEEVAARGNYGDRPPYVPRDVDGRLIQELKYKAAFILLVGPSKSGKSRSAFEAVCTVFGAHTMVAPSRTELDNRSLRRIFELVAPDQWGEEPVVLWLEDLHFYLRARALDTQVLKAWRDERPRVLVLATVTESDYGELIAGAPGGEGSDATGSLAKEIRAVLDEATKIPMQTLASTAELASAQELYPGVDFSVGIGVALVSGPLLVERLQTGGEGHPEGVAVVCAAIDWVRAGMSRPIKRAELEELCRLYLRNLRPRQPISDQAFEGGLAWASASVIPRGSVSLVYAADEGGDSFLPFDYIVAYREGEGAKGRYQDRVPSSTWQWIVGHVSSTEAFAVGLAAYGKGNLDVAIDAMDKAGDSEQDNTASAAIFSLGVLYSELGRSEEAIAVYDQVLERFSDSTVPGVQ